MEEKLYTNVKQVKLASKKDPFYLEISGYLADITVEYETYGELNPEKDNAILITHALSGDAHVAGWDLDWEKYNRPWRKDKPGWWDTIIGPGKPIDTNKYFVICSNVLGSCYGTTGPASIEPVTKKPYGLNFPIVTVGDWVNLQKRLIDYLEIEQLLCVVGGSLGGQQALEWAMAYPDRIKKCAILASAPRLSAQGLAFNAVGRHSIMHDPNFADGNYYGKEAPINGLAAARMLAHITYLSEEGMQHKFGRRLRGKIKPDFDFSVEFEVESYLNYQGKRFVERFDANSYLYITKAMDYYDAAKKWGAGDISKAVQRIKCEVLVATFSSDWLYTPEQGREIAQALVENNRRVSYLSVESKFGHDAFLVETEPVGRFLKAFLKA